MARIGSWGVIRPDSWAGTCPGVSKEEEGEGSFDAMAGGRESRVCKESVACVMNEWTASERKQINPRWTPVEEKRRARLGGGRGPVGGKKVTGG